MSETNNSPKVDELTKKKEALETEVIKNQQLINNLYSRFEVLNRQETDLNNKISNETDELKQLDADLEAKKLVLQNKNLDPTQYTDLQQQVADLNVDKQNLLKDYQELRDRPLTKRISNKLPERHYLPKE
ncbi:Hypothetical protein ADU72_0470 [Pediococcus damnosus]|uniref:Uncharacterized protein n=1 Tax=Pediococcus damnosus TaxID=51663 RepID=A0A0R2HN79_9LACO|nr:hypothetical protein [Pediococcus damnosus]AMV61080.1 Hypothetical protein ADU69_1427 [Pediococcus damnosus]AMV63642.1 Hypothetical protein ADU70_2178 [Pediococcus damnosus]AMV65440.1 Hypothetical protein ADU71_1548 [Pediococcus damnosus]AMV66417.1 Hypothetical protein ADU72_0470 [Pediococcus damnosus]AMV68717.1 Hypothetical protein ADU73_0307 [Pediococcus damnosus]